MQGEGTATVDGGELRGRFLALSVVRADDERDEVQEGSVRATDARTLQENTIMSRFADHAELIESLTLFDRPESERARDFLPSATDVNKLVEDLFASYEGAPRS